MEWLLLVLKTISARLTSAGIIAIAKKATLSSRWRSYSTALPLYKRALRSQLRDMPFIYRGLEAQIATDYVDVELLGVDLETLQAKKASAALLGSDERLKESRRVLFLGNAGVGKTTFQRYAILQLLSGEDRFFYRKERLVPIYIPLKAVDNSGPAPIISYLLARHPLFFRPNGKKRLADLARKRRLFLCLDGYDEISFLSEDRNHVQDELSLIFNRRAELAEPGEALKANHWFYDSIRECRVWLSSRREFFERNPVPEHALQRRRLEDLTALELKGVGGNRAQLARRIFDKYKRNSETARELLSEEYFLYSVDESLDDEIRRLSGNPLFLTVMCYLYADTALKTGQIAADWLRQAEDLIESCIRLLVNDLDEQKARDLPLAQRQGLLRRRNEHPQLKLAFLEYFAGRLFTERVAVFDLQHIKDEMSGYLAETQPDEMRRRIERDLETDVAIRPNLALQLVFCGVFVLVAHDERGALYDFPHRRFREVLAAKHFANPDHYVGIAGHLQSEQYAELLKVFRSSLSFNNPLFQATAIKKLLDRCLLGGGIDLVAETENVIWAKPPSLSIGLLVDEFLALALGQAEPAFLASEALLSEVADEKSVVSTTEGALRESLEAEQWRRASLACSILRRLQPDLLFARLEVMKSDRRVAVKNLMANQLLRYGHGEALELTWSLLQNKRFRRAMAYCLGRYWSDFAWPRSERQKLVALLDSSERALFAYSAWKIYGAGVKKILELNDVYFPIELFRAAEKMAESEGTQWLGDPPRRCYVITELGVDRIRSELGHLQRTKIGAITFEGTPSSERVSLATIVTSREVVQLANLLIERVSRVVTGFTVSDDALGLAVDSAVERFFEMNKPSELRLMAHVDRDRVVELPDFTASVKIVVKKALAVDRAQLREVLEFTFLGLSGLEGAEEFFVRKSA